MNQPQGIIFDMDGLLVDSEPVWQIAETAMLTARGKVYDWSIFQHLVGMGTRHFLASVAEAYELPDTVDALLDEMIERMVTLIPQEVQPRPGALEMVQYVTENNIPCAIASSSPIAIIEAVIASQNWGYVFSIFCSGQEVTHSKPAPDIYLLAAERIGVNAAYCFALEDSPTGARAAVAAGMTCFAVPDPTHTNRAAFINITPHVFDSLHDVRAQFDASYVPQ